MDLVTVAAHEIGHSLDKGKVLLYISIILFQILIGNAT